MRFMNAVSIPTAATRPARPKHINMALQGGGSHGAFTWGVLDALLEDPRIAIDGLSGASAGAVNAVALAHGFAMALQDGGDADAGRAAARVSLRRVWQRVVGLGAAGALAQQMGRLLLGGASGERMRASLGGHQVQRWMSPYQTNPLDINPLRRLLDQEIDFAALARLDSPKVFVSATHVRTGRAEIFHGERLTLASVMASACLPMLFQAVEIEGEHYWDGGYSANPALSPLVNAGGSADIVLVQLNPLARQETPHTPHDISERVNELGFNASLLAQMRSIDFINQLLADGRLQEGADYRRLLLHRIDMESAMDAALPASSKLSTDPATIDLLFHCGRKAAQAWLETHFDALGQRSTVDIQQDYTGSKRQTPLGKARQRA